MRTTPLTILLALVPFSAQLGCAGQVCIGDAICFGYGETGDEDEPPLYPCDEHGVCLLADPDSDVVAALIDEGAFVPHSFSTCEDPYETWLQFADFEGPDNIYAACCIDAGCTWGTQPNRVPMEICYPVSDAWWIDGLVGAIAPLNPWGEAQCGELDPLGWTYDYAFRVYCAQGVVCESWMTDCGCRCDGTYGTCEGIDDAIEQTYYYEDALIDYGWESACTGKPYRWNDWAQNGSGQWEGGSCEFNQAGPGDTGWVPLELDLWLDMIDCDGDGTCIVDPEWLTYVLRNVGALQSDVVDVSRDGLIVTRCGSLCTAVGASRGQELFGVGSQALDPRLARSWFNAYTEFQDGETVLHTSNGPLTLILGE